VRDRVTPLVSSLGVERNHRRLTQTRGIRKITKILWFPGSRPARVGGKTRWMEVLVGMGVGEGFRGWALQEGGSLRWIRMDLEGTLAVLADQVATTILSLGLEALVRTTGAQAGTQVEVVEAGVMEGLEVGADMEVPGEMTIVTVIAITMGEVMTVEAEEATIEVVGAVTVNVGEVAGVVGDTELSPVYASS